VTLQIIVQATARRDLADAAAWYEASRQGLGVSFTAAVRSVFTDAATTPNRFPRVKGETRLGLVGGFPFGVYFRAEPGRILVIAVFPTSRDPKGWQSRT